MRKAMKSFIGLLLSLSTLSFAYMDRKISTVPQEFRLQACQFVVPLNLHDARIQLNLN